MKLTKNDIKSIKKVFDNLDISYSEMKFLRANFDIVTEDLMTKLKRKYKIEIKHNENKNKDTLLLKSYKYGVIKYGSKVIGSSQDFISKHLETDSKYIKLFSEYEKSKYDDNLKPILTRNGKGDIIFNSKKNVLIKSKLKLSIPVAHYFYDEVTNTEKVINTYPSMRQAAINTGVSIETVIRHTKLYKSNPSKYRYRQLS